MRDRSKARNFSASRDEFRRDHERRRAFGLQRRHAERMRQVREREAGCFPADLQVPWATVDDGRPGITGPLAPRATQAPEVVQQPVSRVARAPEVVQQPAPDRDLRAGQRSQIGPAKRPEPTGEIRRQPQRTPSTPSGPTRPDLGRRATPAVAINMRQTQRGPTSPHPARAREHPAPAPLANTNPSRSGPQRPDPCTGPRQATIRRPVHPMESKPYTSGKCVETSPGSAEILSGGLVYNCFRRGAGPSGAEHYRRRIRMRTAARAPPRLLRAVTIIGRRIRSAW